MGRNNLLPVGYFHKVFTLPHELNALVLSNKRVILGLLFRAVSETLLEFGKDPRSRLGGKVGFTLVLHTWNQQLLDHFHLHCVIPAGALSDDSQQWISARQPRYLFSVKALAIVFRGKFLRYLTQAYETKKITIPRSLRELEHPQAFAGLMERLGHKKWVVYSKAPFGGPEQVLAYLGRYTHRVAISNHRLIDIDDHGVTFAYRDSADGSKKKTQTLSGHEFLRRFLLHTLPKGFSRIRHYGLLASRSKADDLAACRQALGAKEVAPQPEPPTAVERLFTLTGIDVKACPSCQVGRMQHLRELPKCRRIAHRITVARELNTS